MPLQANLSAMGANGVPETSREWAQRSKIGAVLHILHRNPAALPSFLAAARDAENPGTVPRIMHYL